MFKDVFSSLLQKNNINTSKLSKEIGISEAVLSKWKNGKTNPSYDNIKKLSQYFKVSINYLFEVEEKATYNIKENQSIYGNIGHVEKHNSNDEEISYIEKAIIQEVKKLSKTEQIQLLAQLNKE